MLDPKKIWCAGVIAVGLAAPLHAQDTQTGTEAQDTAEASDSSAETARDVTVDTVVATVCGTDITIGHLIVARGTLPQQYQQLPDDALFAGLLDQLVQQNALAQTMTGDLSKRAQLALDNQNSGFLAGAVLEDVAQEAVTDEAVQAAYDERFANAEPTQEFNAAHILVETEEEATAVKQELDDGADFAELAKEKSTGPSGPNGGALGWFSPGMMVPEFEQAVMELEPGAVSEPVQTQFGWHVVKLNETRMQDAPPLEEVRAEIEGELQRAAVEARVAAIVEETEIEKSIEGIDPSVLSQYDLLEE